MTTMRQQLPTARPRLSAMAGLSIVELMVGITISLFILAGATLVLTTQLDNNRRLLLEAQVQQDLRTAADMISRDVRRAGFWGRAYCNVWPAVEDLADCPAGNPYNTMTPVGTTELVYDRSTDFEGGADFNNDDGGLDLVANRPRERVGFRWDQERGTIEYLVGNNNWQALTDQAVLRVTQFNHEQRFNDRSQFRRDLLGLLERYVQGLQVGSAHCYRS